MEYLTVDDLVLICSELDYGPIVDAGLLAAAAARPQTSIGGGDAYPDLVTKAAALAESLCRNHALVDGNKRLTLEAVSVFLGLNGYDLDLDQQQRGDLILDIASGRLRSVDAIAVRMPLRSRG